MKKNILTTAIIFLLAFLSSFTLVAQVPEGIVYQAEARDQNGKILQNEFLEVEVNILQGSADGAPVWQGTHEIRTDKYGLFTLTIGEGVSSYNFSDIDWAHYAHFLNVRINYKNIWTDLGTTQFISVPYAMHAITAEHAFTADEIDPVFMISEAANITANDITNLSNLSGVNTGDQDLSLSGNTLALTSDPTPVNLSAFMDNTDAQQLSIDENTISLSDGGSVEIPVFSGSYYDLVDVPMDVSPSGNVGIGVPDPQEALDVLGNVHATEGFIVGSTTRYRDGSITLSSDTDLDIDESTLFIDNANNRVGIGTTDPTLKLDIDGQVRIRGGNPAAGRVLTSDDDGVATWAQQGLSLPFSGETSISGTYGLNISHTATSGLCIGGKFSSASPGGIGVNGVATGASGATYGGYFSAPNSTGGMGVYGGSLTYGVWGIASGASGTTFGGYFSAPNSTGGIGVFGRSLTYGVYGIANGASGTTYGGYFESNSTGGIGVNGVATATSGFSIGGNFESNSPTGRGVRGVATAASGINSGGTFTSKSIEGRGVIGVGDSNHGDNYGGYFLSKSIDGTGVYGNGRVGGKFVSNEIAVRGEGPWAGAFYGNVYVDKDLVVTENLFVAKHGKFRTVSKLLGSFEIDHPLDPANKVLRHSFVESPDMMNIYNGIITTDGNGTAVVILPDYFEALNMDFRYQLTVIGDFAQAIVAEKIINNLFTIRTDKPNVEVSWQVTGVRQDPCAEENRIVVEEYKEPELRGLYYYPQGYGESEDLSIMSKKLMTPENISGESESSPLEQ